MSCPTKAHVARTRVREQGRALSGQATRILTGHRRIVLRFLAALGTLTAAAGAAAPLHANAREMVVSVQVVRRCAVTTSTPETENGRPRVAVQTVCGKGERVMFATSASSELRWPSTPDEARAPVYLQPPTVPQLEGTRRVPTAVITVHF